MFRRLDGRKGVGTLRHVIDSTQTPMGGRLLEERLRNPWRELAPIQETQDAIAWLIAHPENRKKLRALYEEGYQEAARRKEELIAFLEK